MRAGLSARGRYVLYRPSFHGEGWGNRMMALVAATALGIGTGRVVLLDWPSEWALDEFVEAPWGWARWDRAAADALPCAAVTDPAHLAVPVGVGAASPLSPAFPAPLVLYSSYSAFWGALLRHSAFRLAPPLRSKTVYGRIKKVSYLFQPPRTGTHPRGRPPAPLHATAPAAPAARAAQRAVRAARAGRCGRCAGSRSSAAPRPTMAPMARKRRPTARRPSSSWVRPAAGLTC
jgi:hypothetical protein